MDKEKFGTFIKNSRMKKNYTQKQLADKLFIDVTAVSKWERGITYPDITLVPEICKVLGLNEHELIQSSNDTEYRKKMREAEKYIKIKNTIFCTTTLLYLIAIVTCFIINISVNHTLSWFWIVLTSCLTAFTFIPTCTRFFTKYKFFMFICSTFISLFILFLTCTIYTKGNWCLIATCGTLLGYFAIFYPIIFNKMKMYLLDNKYNKIKKYFMLTYSLGLLALTLLLLVVINTFYGISMMGSAVIITICSYGLLFSYAIVELYNINRFIKLGIDGLITYIELIGLKYVILNLFDVSNDYKIDFSDWTNHTDGNVQCMILLSIIFISLIFLVIGYIKAKRKSED